MSDQEKRIQEAITLFQAGRKYSKHGTIKINLNEDGYDVVLSALNEKLQRDRPEPEPLTFNELSERVGKPVYAGVLERWEIIDFIVPETFSIHMRSGNIFRYGATRLYAAEPKGEATT